MNPTRSVARFILRCHRCDRLHGRCPGQMGVLEMAGPDDGWFEATDYFSDEAGSIKKRLRRLEQKASNVRVEEALYFNCGRIIRTNYHHAPLAQESQRSKNKEDWDLFYDPNAPEYTTHGYASRSIHRHQFKQLARSGRHF